MGVGSLGYWVSSGSGYLRGSSGVSIWVRVLGVGTCRYLWGWVVGVGSRVGSGGMNFSECGYLGVFVMEDIGTYLTDCADSAE